MFGGCSLCYYGVVKAREPIYCSLHIALEVLMSVLNLTSMHVMHVVFLSGASHPPIVQVDCLKSAVGGG